MNDADRACAKIAPTWPLDRFIAVNPFWEMVDEPLERIAATLAARSGARLTPPRDWLLEQLRSGRVTRAHLAAAAEGMHVRATPEAVLAELERAPTMRPRRASMIDAFDDGAPSGRPTCRELVVSSISQSCAAFFDDGQATTSSPRDGGLHRAWLHQARLDHAPAILLRLRGYTAATHRLPDDPMAALTSLVDDLGVPESEREAYFHALLLDVNGWASWCAYRRWSARLEGREDDTLRELLAIRLSWEWLLLECGGEAARDRWRRAVASWPLVDDAAVETLWADVIAQRAVEVAYREQLCKKLAPSQARQVASAKSDPPAVQAVFCIDVRSEIYRRSLEASGAVETAGFAGFFGIPAEYLPLGAERPHPRLPGLLAPRFAVRDEARDPKVADRRRARLRGDDAMASIKASPLATFSFVESMGLGSLVSLVVDTLGLGAASARGGSGLTPSEAAALKPRLVQRGSGESLPVSERVALAKGMLRGMGLGPSLARVVLLVGHGSRSTNNPHAAGLDCGACCGQSGEVNARAAAALLNDPAVREGLAASGVTLPETTIFVPALHDTTTDDVALFDVDDAPASHAADLASLRGWLERASERTRRERAPRLGLAHLDDGALRREVERRATDWAEIQPEWGLAGCAAFIAAPRSRTRPVDLEGRAFLHEYRWEDDADGSILELIMTAPMVVAHWINLQYLASTVDNVRYGSGNKVLHNVVGGHLGVFEGNGGDLRIGLPMQSLHDGDRWMHEPLRLSVVIEAPRSAIEAVIAKHATVRALVENGWVGLFQLETSSGELSEYRRGAFHPLRSFDTRS
ncbi:MAG: DUF2309 domain-containing protein [Deltaproteobacteria bacterium]|nr:DUF2309 domain-containing protein [Deltaproteobacteria bacterium]